MSERRFQILDRLGSGGTAEVFRAFDTVLDRFVAIKFLKPRIRLDLKREALALMNVQSPHVVRFYDFVNIDGRSALVMELLVGRSLEDELQEVPPPWPLDEVVNLGLQLCDGIAALHEHGILHRDLKPANVWRHNDGRYAIADLGNARIQGLETLTAPGVLLGTPGYMPPEAAASRATTEATDTFLIAATLYDVATNCSPFPVDQDEQSTRVRVATGRMAGPFPWWMYPDLATCLSDAMALDPSARPTLAQFRERLVALSTLKSPSNSIIVAHAGSEADVDRAIDQVLHWGARRWATTRLDATLDGARCYSIDAAEGHLPLIERAAKATNPVLDVLEGTERERVHIMQRGLTIAAHWRTTRWFDRHRRPDWDSDEPPQGYWFLRGTDGAEQRWRRLLEDARTDTEVFADLIRLFRRVMPWTEAIIVVEGVGGCGELLSDAIAGGRGSLSLNDVLATGSKWRKEGLVDLHFRSIVARGSWLAVHVLFGPEHYVRWITGQGVDAFGDDPSWAEVSARMHVMKQVRASNLAMSIGRRVQPEGVSPLDLYHHGEGVLARVRAHDLRCRVDRYHDGLDQEGEAQLVDDLVRSLSDGVAPPGARSKHGLTVRWPPK
jgi:hypothetical protein